MDRRRYLTIGEAARKVGTTAETLRHYDRIGLVRPSMTDEWTSYRYYTDIDIVRLNTVKALQLMDLPLSEIRKVLEYDSLEQIIAFLDEAEHRADEKIAALERSKEKIRSAKADYKSKLRWSMNDDGISVKEIQERTILLSDTLTQPTLDNLWDYLRHFYEQVGPESKSSFHFEDIAGIYSEDGLTRLFAVCIRHGSADGLKVLPAGRYLYARSTEEDRQKTLQKLMRIAQEEYGAVPSFTIQLVIVSGILQWNYETQIYIGKA